MLDKLKHNKIFLFLILTAFFSCHFKPKVPDFNTEIVCPNGSVTLVKFIRAKDLRKAILISYQNKKLQKTSEYYTPIRLEDGRSFALRNVSPEVASTCDLVESKVGEVDATYVHHF
ncbi:MAG: hypothetical protein SFV53_03490 [Rickettsiales bacterium]|nr:hypothetical protein [Rickettsiales bacterium]